MNKRNVFGGRKKARRLALQSLYGWIISHNPLDEILIHTLKEHEGEHFDKDYFKMLLFEIPNHQHELDAFLSPYLSNRSINELDLIEINILRMGAYELRYRPEIPFRVVINEALELTKTFGAKDSFKFVNGVLDKLARELRRLEYKIDE